VLVTVTPVSGNILTINFQQQYTGQNQPYATGWLDVVGSFPNASAGQSITFGGTTVRHTYVEQVTWVTIGGATIMERMFNLCYSLQSVPLINTASVTNMDRMFQGCSALQSVPLFNTASVTSMVAIFASCQSLQSVPLFNTALVTNMQELFASCQSLQSVPLFNTASVTNMVNLVNSCLSLNAIPALSTASITTSSGSDFGANFAATSNSLDRCQMVFARTVGFANAQMGTTALVEIFNNLVDRSATTSATITITGNWGAALLTAGERAIATGKNWAITG
jgi:surface protein